MILLGLLTATVLAAGCGGGAKSGAGFTPGADASTEDASTGDGSIDASGASDAVAHFGDAEVANCSSQGKPETSLTGTVYDPAANLPLYNVYVYIPNKTPDPIHAGDPTCMACEAPATGSPILGASTDASGHFTLQKGPQDKGGVPVGTNVPLVLQTGKWRRQLVIPHVDACAPNDLDAALGKNQLRLPKNGSEGDMPLIALTSGCDPAECFLRHIGIDDAEFAPPGTAGKHVHFYTGAKDANGVPASSIPGGNTATDTYAWWTDPKNLLKYDIILNACECWHWDRGATAYAAMDAYLNGGGRLFATHFYWNWFAPPTGTADLQSVAVWSPAPNYIPPTPEMDVIDTSFPQGQGLRAVVAKRWRLDGRTDNARRHPRRRRLAGPRGLRRAIVPLDAMDHSPGRQSPTLPLVQLARQPAGRQAVRPRRVQ